MNTTDKIPSFVAFFIIELKKAEEVSNLENLKKVLCSICDNTELILTGELSVLQLPSQEPNCPAYGLSQQLTTSIISLDGWPECRSIAILLHSCKSFDIQNVKKAILNIYPQAKIRRQEFVNWSG